MSLSVATDFGDTLAARIVAEHQAIAGRWLDRLTQLVPVERRTRCSRARRILDHIPELIREMARYLRAPDEQAIAANTAVIAKAQELGQLRHTPARVGAPGDAGVPHPRQHPDRVRPRRDRAAHLRRSPGGMHPGPAAAATSASVCCCRPPSNTFVGEYMGDHRAACQAARIVQSHDQPRAAAAARHAAVRGRAAEDGRQRRRRHQAHARGGRDRSQRHAVDRSHPHAGVVVAGARRRRPMPSSARRSN